MKTNPKPVYTAAVAIVAGLAGVLAIPFFASGHCDTMDGPVVTQAKTALERGDVTPVLKWVKESDEAEVRSAFAKALAVRTKGEEGKELADMYFFETLVRLHRAGEGAPYMGLKPAGVGLSPAVTGADAALVSGSADELVKTIADEVAGGIRRRFTEASQKRMHADESVKAGRDYVAAYVEFVHYVERLHADAAGGAAEEPIAPQGHHHAQEHAGDQPR